MKNASVVREEKASPIVDAVFVIGTGSKNGNEELRYALRNLDRNCPFVRDVYICGECPSWVDTSVVKHLKWPDRFRHAKDANIVDKLRHACEHNGISERILFCSDDQFQTRVCTWDDFAPRWLRQYRPTDDWYENRKRVWHTRLHKTLERDRQRRLADHLDPSAVYYYQPHIWMQIDRDKFIEYAKWCDYEHRDDTIIASGYFNFIDAGGKYNYDHVFISAGQKWPVKETHVAYTDSSFDAAMKYLKETFKHPCKFEKGETAALESKRFNNVKAELFTDALPSPLPYDKIAELVKNDEIAWKSTREEIEAIAGIEDDEERIKARKDLECRWNSATCNGKLYVPVTRRPADDVAKSIRLPEPEAADAGHRCSRCEERRRKAAEAKAAKSAESGAATAEVQPSPTPNSSPGTMPLESRLACLDCAIDHLSSATAYLNSNGGAPDYMSAVMARGEVIVAMRHLGGLGYDAERSRCLEALASWKSENSIFSADTFYDILKSVVEHG